MMTQLQRALAERDGAATHQPAPSDKRLHERGDNHCHVLGHPTGATILGSMGVFILDDTLLPTEEAVHDDIRKWLEKYLPNNFCRINVNMKGHRHVC